MDCDKFGNVLYSERALLDLIYRNQLEFIDKVNLSDSPDIQNFKKISELDINIFDEDMFNDINLENFDQAHQENWFIPKEYMGVNIEEYCYSLCTSEDEKERVRQELEEFQKRKMMPLLKWIKYLVDTCRKHNIIWGVGRGSSVSSFVLFLIGVHKIDSIKYGLDWQDFLR